MRHLASATSAASAAHSPPAPRNLWRRRRAPVASDLYEEYTKAAVSGTLTVRTVTLGKGVKNYGEGKGREGKEDEGERRE